MLYTRKGDKGITFACNQRISKSSAVAEALGALDEINSFLGLCKIKSKEFEKIIHDVQKNLFIIQAEVAGAGGGQAGSKKTISEEKVKELEKIIDEIEKKLPPIKSFFISGGCELSALFDVARTIVRRAERRVVAVNEEKIQKVGENTLAYLNRLSSLLYALARLSNYFSGIKEESPDYR